MHRLKMMIVKVPLEAMKNCSSTGINRFTSLDERLYRLWCLITDFVSTLFADLLLLSPALALALSYAKVVCEWRSWRHLDLSMNILSVYGKCNVNVHAVGTQASLVLFQRLVINSVASASLIRWSISWETSWCLHAIWKHCDGLHRDLTS